MASAQPAEGEEGGGEEYVQETETVVVALRNDDIGVQALKWALQKYGKRADGIPVIFLLLHIVSDVPNAQMKSVRVSESDADRVAIHLRDRVLPFLESMQDLCDLHEVMSSIEVVKDDLRPEAIVDSCARLQANILILGGSENTTTWGTIAFCTAIGKSPPGCRVIVITNGQKVKEISPEGEDIPIEQLTGGVVKTDDTAQLLDDEEHRNGSATAGLPPVPGLPPLASPHPRQSDSAGGGAPPRPWRGVSLFSGKKRSSKKPASNGKVLVKQMSEERSLRDDDSLSSEGPDVSPARFGASLFSQLSIGRNSVRNMPGTPGKSPDRGQGPSASPCRSPILDRVGVPLPFRPDVPQRGDPQGRITVYSTAGCAECRAAKELLRSKGASYVDIALDLFPERRREMESRCHRSSTPQILFNSEYIGDNESLQAMEQQGELEAMIEDVYDTEAPDNVPLPPGMVPGGVDSYLKELKDDPHYDLVRRMKKGISVQDRLYTFHVYKSCFVGQDAVEWLRKDQKIGREEAVVLANKLLRKCFFHHVTREHKLEDAYLFYKFVEDMSSLSSKECLNYGGKVWSKEVRAATVVAEEVACCLQALLDEFASADGRWVDYRGLTKSDHFKRYLRRAEELQRVSVESLTRDERLAFFLNVHNLMVLQVMGSQDKRPENHLERLKLFSKYTYLIGGQVYSLSDIENGVLRGNRKALDAFSKPFSGKDVRIKSGAGRIALPECEPLIHFGLVNGARSSPPLRVFRGASVMVQLDTAARTHFAAGGLKCDSATRQISLSKVIAWYEKDFGKTGHEVLEWILNYVDDDLKTDLSSLASDMNSLTVVYQDYNWTSNALY